MPPGQLRAAPKKGEAYILQGDSELADTWIVQNDDRETIDTMTKKFKEDNTACESVLVFMADEDMMERDVFQIQLPRASLLFCLFHTLRTFRRLIRTHKIGITSADIRQK